MRRRTVLRRIGAGLGTMAAGGRSVDATVDGASGSDSTGWLGNREVARWRPTDVGGKWARLWDPGLTFHDVTVHDGFAYCAYWDAGTWIVDVSDPSNPTPVGRAGHYSVEELADLLDDEERRSAATVEAPGNAHYATVNDAGTLLGVGAEGWDVPRTETRGPGGITLYDVTEKAAPDRLARIPPPRADDETWGGTWVTAHNFAFHGDRLYAAWYQGGVTVHDVSDPATPELVAWWADPEVARFWTARPAVPGEFFVASSFEKDGTASRVYTFPDRAGRQPRSGSLSVAFPQPPPRTGTPFEPLGSVDVDGAAEAVVGEDGRTIYVATGDGFAVVDCSDPTTPTIAGQYRDLAADRQYGPLEAIDDVAVDGDRLVVAGPARNRRLRGFQVYDLGDPLAPTRVGPFFRTTFPIHNADISADHVYLTGNGEPGDPLVIVDVRSPAAATTTATETATTATTRTTDARSPAATITPTAPTGPTTTSTWDDAPDTGFPTPGFGALAALGATGIGLWLRRHLGRDGES